MVTKKISWMKNARWYRGEWECRFERNIFALGVLRLSELPRGRERPQTDKGDSSVLLLVWMCPCHFFQERREGDLRIGHLVVFLFHQCITFFNKCRVSVKVRVLTRPTGSSKYDTTRKNTRRYYTPKRLIRYIYYMWVTLLLITLRY